MVDDIPISTTSLSSAKKAYWMPMRRGECVRLCSDAQYIFPSD